MIDERAPSRPLVILPTFNERENIGPIVRRVREILPQASVWIVDDNSPDGTGELADALTSQDEKVSVIHRPSKLGLGTAYIDAFSKALARDFDVIIQMDADFSHDPEYLPQLVAGLDRADVVVGSRYIPGGGTKNWSAFRQFVSKSGNIVARVGLGVHVRDATGGYRAFRRSALEQLHFDDLRLRGYGFQIEVIFQLERRGLRIVESPIVFVERTAGKSKMSKNIALETFGHILKRRIGMIRGLPEPEPDAGARYARQVEETAGR
ncbi:MAG TPA: polyprenol monophosphomannose synthase [Chloroflexota bacterium]|nr:polyprenol monophosphomannose synthase [Chloroflexota bacterium]